MRVFTPSTGVYAPHWLITASYSRAHTHSRTQNLPPSTTPLHTPQNAPTCPPTPPQRAKTPSHTLYTLYGTSNLRERVRPPQHPRTHLHDVVLRRRSRHVSWRLRENGGNEGKWRKLKDMNGNGGMGNEREWMGTRWHAYLGSTSRIAHVDER